MCPTGLGKIITIQVVIQLYFHANSNGLAKLDERLKNMPCKLRGISNWHELACDKIITVWNFISQIMKTVFCYSHVCHQLQHVVYGIWYSLMSHDPWDQIHFVSWSLESKVQREQVRNPGSFNWWSFLCITSALHTRKV